MIKTQQIGGRGEVVSDAGSNPMISVSPEEESGRLGDGKLLFFFEAELMHKIFADSDIDKLLLESLEGTTSIAVCFAGIAYAYFNL